MPLTFDEIYRVVRLIPKGKVMSYGGVARQCGYPRAARQVGYALHDLIQDKQTPEVPWWRVINSLGRISNIYGPEEQAKRLRKEGVKVSKELRVEMKSYDAEEAVYRKLNRLRKKMK
jgi:methylated-DNA-protein-cysteine methyltransferase-like protein